MSMNSELKSFREKKHYYDNSTLSVKDSTIKLNGYLSFEDRSWSEQKGSFSQNEAQEKKLDSSRSTAEAFNPSTFEVFNQTNNDSSLAVEDLNTSFTATPKQLPTSDLKFDTSLSSSRYALDHSSVASERPLNTEQIMINDYPREVRKHSAEGLVANPTYRHESEIDSSNKYGAVLTLQQRNIDNHSYNQIVDTGISGSAEVEKFAGERNQASMTILSNPIVSSRFSKRLPSKSDFEKAKLMLSSK